MFGKSFAMNYIFFDIECANCQGGQAKICSFGYVMANEDFEILEKEDLIINPKAPFMLTGHRNRPYVKLAYDREEFRKAPDFQGVYDKIKNLMNRPDCLVFGYAADNDAGYLKSEFQRYDLPCVNFTYYDLQKLLRFALGQGGSNQVALSSAAAMFSEEVNQEVHKSDEDAVLTLRVLQGICERTGFSPIKLLEKYPVCRGDLCDNKVLVRSLEGQSLLIHVLGDKSDRIAPKSENRVLYTRFVRHVRPSGAVFPQWLKGLRVCIPEKYAERHYRDTLRLIQLVCDCGGRYSTAAENCHVFVDYPVYNDDGTLKSCAEMVIIEKRRPSQRPAIYAPAQFLTRCGLSEQQFKWLPVPEIRYLLDERYAPKPSGPSENRRTAGETRTRQQRRAPPHKEKERVVIFPSSKKEP